MIATWANVALIHVIDAAIKTHETVHNQNIKFCDDDNDFDNIDKKYINFNSCNLLDMLAALMKTQNKLQLNAKNKNKKITQKQIEKKIIFCV